MVWRGTNILPQSLVEKDPFEILLFSLLIYKKEVMAVISNLKKYRADGLSIYLTMLNKTKQQKHGTWNYPAVISEYLPDHSRLQLWFMCSLELPIMFRWKIHKLTCYVFQHGWLIVWVIWRDLIKHRPCSSETSYVAALLSPTVDLVELIAW